MPDGRCVGAVHHDTELDYVHSLSCEYIMSAHHAERLGATHTSKNLTTQVGCTGLIQGSKRGRNYARARVFHRRVLFPGLRSGRGREHLCWRGLATCSSAPIDAAHWRCPAPEEAPQPRQRGRLTRPRTGDTIVLPQRSVEWKLEWWTQSAHCGGDSCAEIV